MSQIQLPEDTELAGKIIDSNTQAEKVRLDRGAIGWLFGARDHAPFNIAGIVIIICLLIAGGIIIFGSGYQANKDSLTFLGGFVTVALGYVFGKSSS